MTSVWVDGGYPQPRHSTVDCKTFAVATRILSLMLVMVVERFRHGPAPVYERAAVHGRMLPHGLRYIDSWIEDRTRNRCFQLMEADDEALVHEWAAKWDDLVDFEFIPVISSADAAATSGAQPRAQAPSRAPRR